MKQLTDKEMQETKGGSSVSGALFSGIADIIDSISGVVEGVAGIVFEFSHSDQITGNLSNGDIKFGVESNPQQVEYDNFA